MKALVLCAGYGTRLGALTSETPKPMLPLGGEPLLAHTLRLLARHGFAEVAVNLHFRPDAIPEHFGDGARFGVRLRYQREESLLGTAGSVKRLEPFFADVEDFLVLYGDVVTDQDLGALVHAHRERGAAATLVLHRRAASNSVVETDDTGRITRFLERPSDAERARSSAPFPSPWVNSGLQMLSRCLLSRIPAGRPADLPRDLYIPALGAEPLYGFPLTGYRCAIDSPERYQEAENALREGRFRPPGRT